LTDFSFGAFGFNGLSNVNIVLGKNGTGKSHILKQAEQLLTNNPEFGVVRYLSPERGGNLVHNPSMEQNLANPNWLRSSRNQNQANEFRQQSTTQFKVLETLTLREIESTPELRADLTFTFDTVVERINSLLDRVQIIRAEAAFTISDRTSNEAVNAEALSSGESELISLAIECLAFEKRIEPDKKNLLLFDEPDVHLHPDLQSRFATFIAELAMQADVYVVIATHSTSMVGALAKYGANVGFMTPGMTTVEFEPLNKVIETVIPVFGAHPLSSVFNESPILIVEGTDDERIWQQVVRSTSGRISLYPVAVGGLGEMPEYEEITVRILNAVYDKPVGYSLRDRDDGSSDIDDLEPIIRMKLACRAAENLILSDDVLTRNGTEWSLIQKLIEEWISTNPNHSQLQHMVEFAKTKFDRYNADLKEIRMILMSILASSKPWEIEVGQAIANIQIVENPAQHSLQSYLGDKVVRILLS